MELHQPWILLLVLLIYCHLPPASSGVEVFRHEASRLSRAAASRVAFLPPLLAENRLPRYVPQQQQKILRLAVLAPSDPDHQFSLSKILPAITLAARTIERPGGSLSGWRVQIVDRDSKCSSTHGPLEAFDLYNNKAIGQILLFLLGALEKFLKMGQTFGVAQVLRGRQERIVRNKKECLAKRDNTC